MKCLRCHFDNLRTPFTAGGAQHAFGLPKHADDLLGCVQFPTYFVLLLPSKILGYHLD